MDIDIENKKERVMKRKLGDREFVGTLVIDGDKYNYHYAFAEELGKKMTSGDIVKIAKLSGVSPGLASLVLQGKRWNEKVLRNAEIFAKRNEEMGFV